MKTLFEKDIKLKLVETKSGAKLIKIEEDKNHFWLEQNPLKDSKYGVAYRQLKSIYPDLYFFWEIKNGKYTGRLKIEVVTDKKSMDKIVEALLGNKEFMNFKDLEPEDK